MSDKRKLVNVDLFFLFRRYFLLKSQCFLFVYIHSSKCYYPLVSHDFNLVCKSDTIYLKYLIFFFLTPTSRELLKIKIGTTHEFWTIYSQPEGCVHWGKILK